MTGIYNIKVIYEFGCIRCEEVERQEYAWPVGWELLRPTLPRGWQSINGSVYCFRHTVEVLDG